MIRLWDIVKHRLVQYKRDPVTGGIGLQAGGDTVFSTPGNNLAYVIGDSQMSGGYQVASTLLYNNSKGLGEALNYSLGMPFVITNIATGGYTSTQILNTHVPLVLAASPRPSWVLMNGGINDVIGTDDTLANIAAIYIALTRVGIKIVDFGITPNNLSGSQTKRLNTTNRNAFSAKAALTNSSVFYVNAYSPLLDDSSYANATTGNYGATYTLDNLHPNGAGAWRVALSIPSSLAANLPYARVSRALMPYDGTNGDSTNCCLNGLMFLGSGGTNTTGSSGTPPQSWGAGRSNGANIEGVISNVARGGGKGYWMRTTLTNAAGVGKDVFRIIREATTGFSVGQTVAGQCEWQFNVASGDISTLQLAVYAFDAGYSTFVTSVEIQG